MNSTSTVIREPAEARELLDTGGRRLAFIGECPMSLPNGNSAPPIPPACSPTCITTAPQRHPTNSRACARPRDSARVGHVAAAAAYHAGASEFEVHQAYCSAIGLREQELPYGNIVAFGDGAAVLHYTTLGRRRDVPRPDLPDRCRGAVPRLRERHHPHARRARGCRRDSFSNCSAGWMRCSCNCARPCSPVAITATSTC